MSIKAETFEAAQNIVADVMRNVPKSHNIEHVRNVMNHTQKACDIAKLSEEESLIAILAALMHELDDSKLKKYLISSETARKKLQIFTKFPIAESLLLILPTSTTTCYGTLRCISLVSASTNGLSLPYNVSPWEFIPRDADRLEAIGLIGIERTWRYTREEKKPLFCAASPRCITSEQVIKTASDERFQRYCEGQASASMMCHFYDKLLHIHKMSSGNSYMEKEAMARRDIMIDFCIFFGTHNTMTDDMVLHFLEEHGHCLE